MSSSSGTNTGVNTSVGGNSGATDNTFALPTQSASGIPAGSNSANTNTFSAQKAALSLNVLPSSCVCNTVVPVTNNLGGTDASTTASYCNNPCTNGSVTFGCAANAVYTGNLSTSKNPCPSGQTYVSSPCIAFCDSCGADKLNFNVDQGVIVERGVMLFSDFGCNQSKSWMEIVPDGSAPLTISFMGNNLSSENGKTPNASSNYKTTTFAQIQTGGLVARLRVVYVDNQGNITDKTFTTNSQYTIPPYNYTLINNSNITNFQIIFPIPGFYSSSGYFQTYPQSISSGLLGTGSSYLPANGGGIASIYVPPHLQIKLASLVNVTNNFSNGVPSSSNWFTSQKWITTETIPGTGYTYTFNQATGALVPVTTPAGTFPLGAGPTINYDQDGALRAIQYNNQIIPLYLFDLGAIQIQDRGVGGLGAYVNRGNTDNNGFNATYFMSNQVNPSVSYQIFHLSYKYCMYAACMNNTSSSGAGGNLNYGPVTMAWKRALASFIRNPNGQVKSTTADTIMADYCKALTSLYGNGLSPPVIDRACGCYTALSTNPNNPNPVPAFQLTVANTTMCPYNNIASCNSVQAYVPSYFQPTCFNQSTTCASIVAATQGANINVGTVLQANTCPGSTTSGGGGGTGDGTGSGGGDTGGGTGSGGGTKTPTKPKPSLFTQIQTYYKSLDTFEQVLFWGVPISILILFIMLVIGILIAVFYK